MQARPLAAGVRRGDGSMEKAAAMARPVHPKAAMKKGVLPAGSASACPLRDRGGRRRLGGRRGGTISILKRYVLATAADGRSAVV